MDAAFFMIWLYEEVKTFCIMDNIKKKKFNQMDLHTKCTLNYQKTSASLYKA